MNKYLQNSIDFLKKIWVQVPSRGLSIREQTFFIKRLSFLIKAGVPILDSLVMIKEQTSKKNHSVILETIITDVSEGRYLSTSMAKFNKTFGDFSINIISFGESTGMLSENLEYLAEELKKKNTLRKKIIGAFIYPIIITLATFGITVFLMVYLFPKIIPVFSSLHVELPLSTKIVIFLSNFLRHYYIFIILGSIASLTSLIVALKKKPAFRFYFDKFILKLPIIGEVIQNYNLANTTRTLGILLKSGVTLEEALNITVKITGNTVYQKEFIEIMKFTDRGEQMSTYFALHADVFPEIFTQIISVGERSGHLSKSLLYLSELYEGEIEDFTKNLSNTIEPVLMIIMGVLVGFIAISIITPIYSITQNLTPK